MEEGVAHLEQSALDTADDSPRAVARRRQRTASAHVASCAMVAATASQEDVMFFEDC